MDSDLRQNDEHEIITLLATVRSDTHLMSTFNLYPMIGIDNSFWKCIT